MTEETKLKACSYWLVRYVPDLVKGEFVNIGLFLYNPEEGFLDCMITNDFGRVRRLHRHADLEFLRELQEYFTGQIQAHETELEKFIREMQESFSNLIQVTTPQPCLLMDPPAEMQGLFNRYVGIQLAGPPVADTRMRIKLRMTEAFRRHGLLDHKLFERRIPAEKWTQKGDPFCFDFGYRALLTEGKPNGHIQFVQALSLHRDNELATVLKDRILKVRAKEPADLTAIVEGLPAPDDDPAVATRTILEEAQILIQPIAGVDSYAQSVRRDLLMPPLAP